MIEYTIAECPYPNCKYVWRVRGNREPKSCPKGKHRFDVPWCPDKLKLYTKQFPNYDALQKFLEEKNKGKQ